MRGHVYMRGGAECYVMRYLVAMISTLRSPLPVTLFSLTLIGLLSSTCRHCECVNVLTRAEAARQLRLGIQLYW